MLKSTPEGWVRFYMKPQLQDIKIGPEFIGHALRDKILFVPPNQREYSWEKKHVTDLFTDLQDVIEAGAKEYFLGTIVVTDDPDDRPRVVDGQQRLATTVILLAAFRDYLEKISPAEARKIENLYLIASVLGEDDQPHLNLSDKDRAYFKNRVLLAPTAAERKNAEKEPPKASSHILIDKAARFAKSKVRTLTDKLSPDVAAAKLLKWIAFLEKSVVVIWVKVPNDRAAYMVFETMNDRGLDLSATDLIKNHLFYRAGDDSLGEAQRMWASMVGALETVQETDIIKDFVRHYWISRNGPVRTQELFGELKDATPNKPTAMSQLASLAAGATQYVAILNPMSGLWLGYTERSRKNLMTLGNLGVKQIRPLLLSVIERFPKREIEKVIRLAISWSVRFLVSGELGSGALESSYGTNARDVINGTITDAEQLGLAMASIVPADDVFESAFATVQVTKGSIARYYLRCLEAEQRGDPEPENVPNDDLVVNAEHILPQDPAPDTWKNFSAEERQNLTARLGNLALLKTSVNSGMQNDFLSKKKEYKDSGFKLTSELADIPEWTPSEVVERQKRLAKLAIKAWPLKI
jgi:hypothetical protein